MSYFLLSTVGKAVMGKVVHVLFTRQLDTTLGWVGLARRRSHRLDNAAFLCLGAFLGAGAGLLLMPAKGASTTPVATS